MEQPHSSPHGGPQGRGLLKRPDSSYANDSPARKQSRWEKPKSSGLLGNPMQPNSLGLETLAASVGHNASPYNVTQAALLNPLVLAQQDPSMLEAQLKAIKALQAGSVAMNRQEPSFEHRDHDNEMDNNNRGRRQDGNIISHVLKEVNEMRKMQGRVLYLRYKSNRIMESDLRQLAEAFGKVTNLLTIRAKIPNGYHQAFMEMDHWDCAAAMLERYMTKSPLIKGCVVMVQKSNYKDLKLRYAQNRGPTKRNRSLSVSPVRKGTTQLGDKRGRDDRGRDAREDRPARSARDTRDDRSRKSLENSRSNNSAEKRVAPRSEEKRRSERERDSGRRRTPDKDRRKRESRRSNERKRTTDRKPNETTSDANKSSDPKKSSEQKKSSDAGKLSEKIVEKEEKEEIKMKEEEKQDGEAGKVKDEIDPLDTIADELALHDEFVLMDEVGYEPSKKKIEKSDLSDLEGGVLDLENLNVDVAEDKVDPEVAEDQGSQDAGTEEEEQKDESTDDKENLAQEDKVNEKKDGNEKRDEVNDEEEKEEVNDEEGAGEEEKVQERLDDMEQKKEEELDSKDRVDEQENEIQETGMNDGGEAREDEKEDLPVVGVTPSREGSPTEDLKDVEVGKMEEGSQKEEDDVVDAVTENLKEIKGMETNLSTTDQDTNNTTNNHIMSHDDPDDTAHDTDNHMNETSQSHDSDDRNENHENTDDVTKLKEAISITLTYVESAQEHLTALTKVTKNKAAQAVAKKLRLCLEEAASSLTCVADDVKGEE
nr:protein starmaker isoform X2 [Ciona intestinalis]|eukprot:XP_018671943.1 protein starmaker isoform X2 [Ciona intestinalis]